MPDSPSTELRQVDSKNTWLAEFPPRRLHIIVTVAILAVLYLVTVTGKWWPTPDSALYTGLGRSLAEGNGYQFNGRFNNDITPGLPFILAGTELLFGRNFWAPNFLMAAFGLVGLLLIYKVSARLSDRRTAFAIALTTGFSFTFYYNSHRILTDIPFMTFFWCGIYVLYRKRQNSAFWPLLAGVFMAISVLIRGPGMALVVIFSVSILFDRMPSGIRWFKGLLQGASVLVPAVLTCLVMYYLALNVTQNTPLYVGDISQSSEIPPLHILNRIGAGLAKLPFATAETIAAQEALVPVGAVVLALGVVGGVAMWKRGQRSLQLTFILYVIVLCIMGRERAVRPRYLMPVAPMLLLMGFLGLFRTVSFIANKKYSHVNPRAFLKAATVLTIIIIACNIPRLGRHAVYYTYASYTPDYYRIIKSGRFNPWFEVSESINRESGSADKDIGLIGEGKSVIHFLTNQRCIMLYDVINKRENENLIPILSQRRNISFIVINKNTLNKIRVKHVCNRLETETEFTPFYQGEKYIAYERS